MRTYQQYDSHALCLTGCEHNNITRIVTDLTFFLVNNKAKLYRSENRCRSCQNVKTIRTQFKHNPIWLFVQTNVTDSIFLKHLPKNFVFNNKSFYLLCATIFSEHFRAIFFLNNEFYLVDDLKSQIIDKHIPDIKITSIFYYRK